MSPGDPAVLPLLCLQDELHKILHLSKEMAFRDGPMILDCENILLNVHVLV